MYGDVKCFNIPARADVTLPDITFAEMKEKLFASARSRTDVFDYRHSMRYLHAIVEYVHDFSTPGATALNPVTLGKKLIEAVKAIRELNSKEILLR